MSDTSGQSSSGTRSFFLSNFTSGDWLVLAGTMIAFLTFLGWITDVVSEGNLMGVKTELALVKDSIDEISGEKARQLQGLIEDLSQDSSVQTEISCSDTTEPASSALNPPETLSR